MYEAGREQPTGNMTHTSEVHQHVQQIRHPLPKCPIRPDLSVYCTSGGTTADPAELHLHSLLSRNYPLTT
jgi:hypothetical protein